LLYDGPLLCGFNVAIKGLINCLMDNRKYRYTCSVNRTEEKWRRTSLTDFTTYVNNCLFEVIYLRDLPPTS